MLTRLVNVVRGGLGNQLFQHCFAMSLAKRSGAQLLTDISYFTSDPYNRKAVVCNVLDDVQLVDSSTLSKCNVCILKDSDLRALDDFHRFPTDAEVVLLYGYWQREELLDSQVARAIYESICESVQSRITSDLFERVAGCSDGVAVHIRRHDYAHMGVCSESYYLASMRCLREKYPAAEIFVFSDEPNFARHLLSAASMRATFIQSGDDLVDFYVMSLCRHFVISNSTFSWWAAYFSESKGGEIICPEEWVTIGGVESPCPARWSRIEGAVRSFQISSDEVAAMESRVRGKVSL